MVAPSVAWRNGWASVTLVSWLIAVPHATHVGERALITTYPNRRRPQLMTAAGILVAIGALFMVTKGVVRAATGADPSLVPFFSVFAGAGLVAASSALWGSARRQRWLCATAGALAAGGTAAAVVAIAYLVTGTIPETSGASPVVGGSYAAMSIGVFGSLVALGVAVAVNRALEGWWRWLPLGLIAAQFPIFAIADAAGEVSGSDVVADGFGLALTGLAWMVLGYGFTRAPAGQNLTPTRA